MLLKSKKEGLNFARNCKKKIDYVTNEVYDKNNTRNLKNTFSLCKLKTFIPYKRLFLRWFKRDMCTIVKNNCYYHTNEWYGRIFY